LNKKVRLASLKSFIPSSSLSRNLKENRNWRQTILFSFQGSNCVAVQNGDSINITLLKCYVNHFGEYRHANKWEMVDSNMKS